jgi:hypothetical protein
MKRTEVQKALGPLGVLVACSQVSPLVEFSGEDTVAGAHLRATWRRAATPAEIAYLECHAKQQAFLFLDVDIAEASHG